MKLALNCGSGQRPFISTPEVEWWNWDIQEVDLDGKHYTPNLLCDLKDKWQAEDGSVDYVVLHHVVEHEGCGEALHYQREAHRVLKPGGSLLIFVPDMRALAQRWLLGKLSTQIYLTNVYGAYMGDEHDRHRWGYTSESLAEEMGKCEWAEVKAFDWRAIPGADLAKDFWILGWEAVK
jgi:predicted SAM-dependent methyltransferase